MNRRDFLLTASAAAAATAMPITPVVAEASVTPMNAAVVVKPTLKMFHNGIDTVICEDINEARWLVAEQYYGKTALPTTHNGPDGDIWGYHYTDRPVNKVKNLPHLQPIYFDEVDGMDDWHEYDMDMEFRLWEEYPGNNEVKKTVAEWIEEHGKGYFACTEY